MSVEEKHLLETMVLQAPENLFSKDTARHIQRLATSFEGFQTSEVIVETNLNDLDGKADISFRVLKEEAPAMLQAFLRVSFDEMGEQDSWQRLMGFCRGWPEGVKEVWIEMDQVAYEQRLPQPCFFYDGSGLHPQRGIDQPLLRPSLEMLLDHVTVRQLEETLLHTLASLPEGVKVFQLGTMLARHQDRLRLFTTEMDWQQVQQWTAKLKWKGAPPDISILAPLVNNYSDGRYILDVDITEEGINPKLGLNFGLSSPRALASFLENLQQAQLCTQEMVAIMQAWPGTHSQFFGKGAGLCGLFNRFSHFKLTQQVGSPLSAKVYLQTMAVSLKKQYQKSRLMRETAKATQPLEKGSVAYRQWTRQAQANMKQLFHRSMLDQDYRQRCLEQREKVLRETFDREVPPGWQLCLIEKDTDNPIEKCQNPWRINLPPYLKKTWLNSKPTRE